MRCLAIVAILAALAPTIPAAPDATITVDWTHPTGRVNRALFSTQGFMQVYVEPDPMVMETFARLNPEGTQTRLETWISRLEPENDNDDPETFDWDRLHTDRMIRFIEDIGAFEDVYKDRLGMEPLVLLGYGVDWLSDNDANTTISDNEEWAEFAAAVVEHYNGRRGPDYAPNLKYLQVWNEPNMGMFYQGTRQSYFDLYNTVADRIRRDYPGVMIGGPTITHSGDDPEGWMRDFVAECGPNADYLIFHHYGPQGQGHEILVESVRKYAEMFRQLPGKENGRVMITETDAWFQGWDKMQFILDRQFAFLSIQNLLLAVHHFCCMEYNESGNYSFGLVDKMGGIIPGTYRPYWLFRNLAGEHVYTLAEGEQAPDIQVTASSDTRGDSQLSTAVVRNRAEESREVELRLTLPDVSGPAVLLVDRLVPDYQGTYTATPVSGRQLVLTAQLDPGEARAYTVTTAGKPHFAFSDMNHQRGPALDLWGNDEPLSLGDERQLRVSVLNARHTSLRGTVTLKRVPGDWTLEPQGGTDIALEPGARTELVYTLTAESVVLDGRISPYAEFVPAPGDDTLDVTRSIPLTIPVRSPLETQVVPTPVYAVPGEPNLVELQLRNTSSEPIDLSYGFEIAGPIDAGTAPPNRTLQPGERLRERFPLSLSGSTPPGDHTGEIEVRFLGAISRVPFTVTVVDRPAVSDAVMLDLTDDFNYDAVSFATNRDDYTKEMGMFIYPADFTPSDRELRTHGVPFRMPSLEDGKLNALLPKGQLIAVPEDEYAAISMIGFGHDGKHPGTWELVYTDGSTEAIDSQIPEWCTPPPPGFARAFRAPHRYVPYGNAHPPTEMFTWTWDVDPDRALEAVRMPEFDRGAYIFAITLHRR